MSVLNKFQYRQYVYLEMSAVQRIIYRPDLQNIQVRRKKQKVGNSWNWTFYFMSKPKILSNMKIA